MNDNQGGTLEGLLRASVAGGGKVGAWHRVAGEPATSRATTLWRMRRAAYPHVGTDVARELVATIGSVLALVEPGEPPEDVAALVRESLARLQRMGGRHGSPVVRPNVDVERLAAAVAAAWEGGR